MNKQRIKIFKTNILSRISRRPCKIRYSDEHYYVFTPLTKIIYL